MIQIEYTKVSGWEAALRGMRNPMNSWGLSDTDFDGEAMAKGMGINDHTLAQKLADAGQVHGKYLRMINVAVDITAPMYWWQEFDTYKVGTVRNSCSKMHKMLAKRFTVDDFSHEKIAWSATGMIVFTDLLADLNELRSEAEEMKAQKPETAKRIWYQILQLLPASYNQRSTVQMNYAVLKNIYEYRRGHKLDEWKEFCRWIESLPYSELIIGGKNESE